jgi:tetratricopeptide (TPR) repeat protein
VTRLARIALVMGLAAALFLAAGVGVFPRFRQGPAAAPDPIPAQSALLGPAVAMDGTVAALQVRLRQVPDDWRAQAALGLAYVQQARVTADPSYYPKAQGILQASLTTQPTDNADALVGLAALAAARHDFSTALDFAQRARAVEPYDANVQGVVGDALVELGRYREAFHAYQTMVDMRPDTASFARVSYARELLGDVRGAIAAMRRAKTFAFSPSDRAWTSYQLGELFFAQGRLHAAAGAYHDGTRLDPTYVPSFAGLAKVAWAHGDIPHAIAGYEDVVGRLPAPEYVIALGDLYAVGGDRASAERSYELVHAEARLFRANGVNTDLELALFDADHHNPADALHAAGAEWGRRRSIHVADALAWALYRSGEFDRAAVYSKQALKLGTNTALLSYHAGMIELGLGHDRRAEVLLRRALSTNPSFSILGAPEARLALARLEGGR